MKLTLKTTLAAAAALLASAAALADVKIGITLSLTGPASGLGIPVGNQFKLWPQTIAGEKVQLIILDDASDPGKGVTNARRFVTDEKVDILFGGSITTVSSIGCVRVSSPRRPSSGPHGCASPSARSVCARGRMHRSFAGP